MPPFGVNIDLINKRTLHHQISEFCLQQYSGRLEFFQEGNEIRRIKIEVYLEPLVQTDEAYSAVLASMEKSWAAVDAWLEHNHTLLSIEFQHGRIVGLRIKDALAKASD